MSSFDEIYERIKEATSARTQVELASMLEIRQSSISDAKRRQSVPSDWYLKLHDKLGLNIDWLRRGTGPVRNGAAALIADENADEAQDIPPEAARETPVPLVKGESSGLDSDVIFSRDDFSPGEGFLREEPPRLFVPQGVVTPILQMACDYVESEGVPDFTVREQLVLPASLVGEEVLVFYIDAGGMAPTLRRGGCAGVSTKHRHLVSGEIFALLMPHEGVAFRRIVQDSENGLFLLCFDQAGLPATRLPAQSLQSRVLGKVLWTLQPV